MSVKFSHKIPKLKRITDRTQYIKKIVQGKKVLHGGCVDSGILEERIESNQLLHSVITEAASEAIGVDVDCEGIEKMKELGFTNVVCGDLESWDYEGTFDVIIMGEIIEHVDNCGEFLKTIARFCNDETMVIFTTPNSYYFLFWLYTLIGKESIHADHNYLFSFISLRTLLGKFNFEVTDNAVLWTSPGFYRASDSLLKKIIMGIATSIFYVVSAMRYIWPQYGNNLIVTAKYRPQVS